MITRTLQKQLEARLFKGKAILLTGARQVGKTTLLKQLLLGRPHLFLDGDDPVVRKLLEAPNTEEIRRLVGKHQLVFMDEAQRIPGIGVTLKIITDQLPEIQLLVSGSSAFDLRSQLEEPLTGRKWAFELFPVSWQEYEEFSGYLTAEKALEDRLIYGLYPDVLNNPGQEKEVLMNLANSYLYRDLLAFSTIRKPEVLEKLVQALALQVGSEVNYNELAQLTGLNKGTVQSYMELLEKGYVIFRIGSFSGNLRNEIKQSRKVYFYDNGLRNAVLSNFSPLEMRPDKGALWENFLASERIKQHHYQQTYAHAFFWRTKQQQEIDWVETQDGKLTAYEFKWKNTRFAASRTFLNAYDAECHLINRENFRDFVLLKK